MTDISKQADKVADLVEGIPNHWRSLIIKLMAERDHQAARIEQLEADMDRAINITPDVVDAALWEFLEYVEVQTKTKKVYPSLDWKVSREWTISVARVQMFKALSAALNKEPKP